MINISFDIVKNEDGSLFLHSVGKMYQISFEDESQKIMFNELVSDKYKSYKSLINYLLQSFDKEAVFNFFHDLKEYKIIYFDTENDLLLGNIYSISWEQKIKSLNGKNVGIVIPYTNEYVSSILKNSELFHVKLDYFLYNPKKISVSKIQQFIRKKDFIIIDSTSFNPLFLIEFNKCAFLNQTPWLLVSSFRAGKSCIGPLFYGKESGCYECYLKRFKSTFPFVKEYKVYENWLIKEQKNSNLNGLNISNYKLMWDYAVIETEKFLLNYSFPQTYKSVIEINLDEFINTKHRFYRVPFCKVCYSNEESKSHAPWLDPITIEK